MHLARRRHQPVDQRGMQPRLRHQPPHHGHELQRLRRQASGIVEPGRRHRGQIRERQPADQRLGIADRYRPQIAARQQRREIGRAHRRHEQRDIDRSRLQRRGCVRAADGAQIQPGGFEPQPTDHRAHHEARAAALLAGGDPQPRPGRRIGRVVQRAGMKDPERLEKRRRQRLDPGLRIRIDAALQEPRVRRIVGPRQRLGILHRPRGLQDLEVDTIAGQNRAVLLGQRVVRAPRPPGGERQVLRRRQPEQPHRDGETGENRQRRQQVDPHPGEIGSVGPHGWN